MRCAIRWSRVIHRCSTHEKLAPTTRSSFSPAEITPAEGLIPFPTIDESMFRRLDEAWRLYRIQRKPIIVSGGHVNPFTPDKNENQIACDYLIRWGVPKSDVIGEGKSRDTFESAVEVHKLLQEKGWKNYLLVTSAVHMPRSMLAFTSRTPEPIPAPGDFSLGKFEFNPFNLFPGESARQHGSRYGSRIYRAGQLLLSRPLFQ